MNDVAFVDPAPASAVVVALGDTDRTASLLAVLSRHGLDVAVAPGIEQIAEWASPDDRFVAIVENARPDWLREVADLVHQRPRVQLLALVDLGSAAELVSAVSVGVRGFVSPRAGGAAISRTVNAMIDGEVAIPRGFVSALVDEVRRNGGRSVETATGSVEVTDREWQILQLLLQHRSTGEIAEKLFVSAGTVRTHISALGRKLGAEDREDTIRLLQQRPR